MDSTEFDYKKYLKIVLKHKVLMVVSALLIMSGMAGRSLLLPNVYEARSTIFVEKSVIADLLRGLAVTPSADDKIRVLSYAMNSRTLVTKVLDELDLTRRDQAEQEKLIRAMQEHTQIRTLEREGLFVISFVGTDPKLARDYVNTLVRRYIEENTSSKRQDSYGATEFVSEQLDAVKAKLEKAEKALTAYKTGAGATATLDPGILQGEIAESQQRLDEIRVRQAQLKASLAGLAKVSSAQEKIEALKRRLQELQLHYTDSYPEIQQVKDDIQALTEQRSSGQGIYQQVDSPEYQKLASELSALRQAERNISSGIARNRGLLSQIPAGRATLDELERERNSQKGLYESLLAKRGQSEVSKQVEVQDKATVFRIVDPAVIPPLPIGPNRVRLMLFGIVAGIGGGLALAFGKDLLDGSVKDVDMARRFDVPLLAVIPRIDDPLKLAAQAKRDKIFYVASSLYFSLFVLLIAAELGVVPPLTKLLGMPTH